MAYLWRTYHRLRRRMASGFAGPNPVGWQDIDAFVRQTGFRLAPWELETIEGIDNAYLDASIASKKATPPAGDGVVDPIPMTDGKSVKALMRSIGRRRKKGGR